MSLLTLATICTIAILVPHMANIKTARDKRLHALLGILQTAAATAIILLIFFPKIPYEIKSGPHFWIFLGFAISVIENLNLATEVRARKPGLIVSYIITISLLLAHIFS